LASGWCVDADFSSVGDGKRMSGDLGLRAAALDNYEFQAHSMSAMKSGVGVDE